MKRGNVIEVGHSSSKRSGGREDVDLTMLNCICYRPKALVMCRVCGWIRKESRVRRICGAHPRTLFLMDVIQCHKCLSYPPLITEYPSDVNNNV